MCGLRSFVAFNLGYKTMTSPLLEGNTKKKTQILFATHFQLYSKLYMQLLHKLYKLVLRCRDAETSHCPSLPYSP